MGIALHLGRKSGEGGSAGCTDLMGCGRMDPKILAIRCSGSGVQGRRISGICGTAGPLHLQADCFVVAIDFRTKQLYNTLAENAIGAVVLPGSVTVPRRPAGPNARCCRRRPHTAKVWRAFVLFAVGATMRFP